MLIKKPQITYNQLVEVFICTQGGNRTYKIVVIKNFYALGKNAFKINYKIQIYIFLLVNRS